MKGDQLVAFRTVSCKFVLHRNMKDGQLLWDNSCIGSYPHQFPLQHVIDGGIKRLDTLNEWNFDPQFAVLLNDSR